MQKRKNKYDHHSIVKVFPSNVSLFSRHLDLCTSHHSKLTRNDRILLEKNTNMISNVSSLHANVQQYEVFIMNRIENEVLKVLKMIYIQTFALCYKCFALDLFRHNTKTTRYIIASVILQGKKVFLYKEKSVMASCEY